MSISETHHREGSTIPGALLPALRGAYRHVVVRKLLQAAFVAWASLTLAFSILYLLPGDPVSIMLGAGGDAQIDPADLEALRARYGFDRHVLVQYADGLWRALHLDFGVSHTSGRPVVSLILEAIPATAGLAGLSLVISVALGTLIAVLSVPRPGNLGIDAVFSKLPAVLVPIPTFVVGLMLIQIFAFQLRLLPAIGAGSWKALILPAITLAVPASGMLAQVLTKTLRHTYDEPFVRMMRARGFSEMRILRHALRSASLPPFTMAGLIVGGTLAGAVVTETVFSRQGIGRLMQLGVNNQDINLVCGLIVFSALVYVFINLVVDLLYPVLDPRVHK